MRLIIFLMCCPALAEELAGLVRDSSGLPIAGATVKARGEAMNTSYSGTTNGRGEYHLLGLTAARYTVSVEQPLFMPVRESGVPVRIGETVTLNFTLRVGQASDSVQVISAAGDANYHVDQVKTASLPLDGRNFVPLIALSPGVALPGGGSLLPRINGSRPRTNEYIYDGIGALQPEPGQVAFYPIIDAIEEFRINVNSYSPEYGRSNGGTVLVRMRSGGNQLHGTVFEFLRNEAFNARNYFAPAGAKPEFRRNQYGFVAGGPVQKDKTFFFVDWQGTRLRTGITRFSTVPVQQVFSRYPAPNLPGAANNYVRTAVEPDNQDQFDARLDRNFKQSHRVFARYSYLRDEDVPVTPLPDGSGSITSGVVGHTKTRAGQFVGEYAWAPTPYAFNQARFGYTERNTNVAPLVSGPTYMVAGYQQIGPASGATSQQSTSVTELLDTFSLVRGSHTLKFGGDLRREALNVFGPPNPQGLYTFDAAGTGNALTSLLLGQVSTYSIDIQTQTLRERAHIAEFFVGDEWRVTSRLAVNLGTRYTLNFPSTEAQNHGAVFNLATQQLDFPHTARKLECCDFGPRLGIAYRIRESWALRAGYGMVWFEQTGITTPFTVPQFPFVQTVGLQSFSLSNAPKLQPVAADANAGLGQGVFGVQRNNGSGYSQQWNGTVQKANFEVGYLGSKNTRLGLPEANLNQLPAAYLAMGPALLAKVPNPYFGQLPATSSLGGPTITQQQLLRAYPRFTTVALFRNNVGNSTYHAVYAKWERRFSRGLTFTFAYTFSKLIDDASSYFSQSIFTGPVLNNTGAADAFNRHLEKDVSTGDIPRVFSGAWVYEIPRWWKLSGWRLAGTVRVQAGDAVAVSQATNLNASLGYAVQRPNRIADPNTLAQRGAAHWFNTADFRAAPQFTIGNSSRNPVRGPGLQQADLMLGKSIRLSERAQLEIRAEAFNVSNTPPLNDPNGSFGSAAFGSITSAGNPRVFEAAAKIHF